MSEQWSTARIADHVEIQIGGTPSRSKPSLWAEKPAGIPWASIADLKNKYIDQTKEHITALGARCSNVKLIPTGSTIMSFKLSVGRTAITQRPIYCNEAIAIFLPQSEQVNAAWLYHALPRSAKTVITDTAVKGATLNKQKMAEMKLDLPPASEQVVVAKILDTLDTAIQRTEAIIEKLKEVKQGLLHDLLTRGIDANGELRPPVEVVPQRYKKSPLGMIPKEWDANNLEQLSSFVTSGSRGWASFYSNAGDLFVRSQNVRMGHLDFSDRQLVRPPLGGEGQRTKLEVNDLLITITGNSVGNVAFIPGSWSEIGYVSQHVGLVRLINPGMSEYIMNYLIQGSPGNRQIIDAQYGQSKPGLNLDNLKNIVIPMPKNDERIEIVKRLSSSQLRIEHEMVNEEKFKKLKSGLMDDLLTGRIRVTNLLATTAP